MFAGPSRSCLACLQLVARPIHARPAPTIKYLARRAFASSSSRLSDLPTPPPPPPSPPPPPPPKPDTSSSTFPFSPKWPPRGATTARLVEARSQAQVQLNALLSTLNAAARKQGRAWASALAALELERKLREVGGKINEATGYEEIDRLRRGVAEREQALLACRELAAVSKKAYSAAVTVRADSQREVNDLLQRKSSWTSADVLRFTELIQQDHENERAESKAKATMDGSEENVEKGFSDLMQAILERYHEEQVWSDKIRSLSTYGSLAITSLNVLLFIVTILLVEPWKRKRLVEGVEARLRTSTHEGQEATLSSLVALQELLTDAQRKLDVLVAPPPPPPPSPDLHPPSEEPLEAVVVSAEPADSPATDEAIHEATYPSDWLSASLTRDQELLAVGGAGAAFGVLLVAVVSSLRG